MKGTTPAKKTEVQNISILDVAQTKDANLIRVKEGDIIKTRNGVVLMAVETDQATCEGCALYHCPTSICREVPCCTNAKPKDGSDYVGSVRYVEVKDVSD